MLSEGGILNVLKPSGWTSFDVVAFVRGRTRVRRVGHAGTLDPLAEGVLPVCLGPATRVIEYLIDATKVYVATILLGVVTDTYDLEGTVLARARAVAVARHEIEAALERFRGEIEQRPPAFSALKREGVPLYRLARRGADVQAPPRKVTIARIDTLRFEPPELDLEVECGKGTYLRSLAHDLGQALGTGACLARLRRTRVGPFRIEDAVDEPGLRSAFAGGEWRELLRAPDEVLLEWPAMVLGEDNARAVVNGRPPGVTLVRPTAAQRCRAYSVGGRFLAVLQRSPSGAWRPQKVFTAAS